ncbi:2-C-methyl-D-erythritol 4-phosphate cytidylyltransferase [Marinoscillum sp. MHG1-6]|uniref:2-C-methyl-D-erythritol 4-phosphate cytidylyltransferase n=1 Tax=Marinoscillum sp. MHG1-6 TaxID=2959627 RepID=UPI002156FA30|nr:2-C-methyl-D-erythritol 4-phosphate cytidylyltransferase [Marinoscillum sp. MHG1-6]
MSRNNAIIVAGGSGTRMNLATPKQFLEIHEVPVVVHTIQAFLAYDPDISLVLVLPANHFDSWMLLKSSYLPDVKVQTAKGGETRYQSVKNGLELVKEGLVAIHDAVRPCVTQEVIQKSFEAAERYGSGIVTTALKDSIRKADKEYSHAMDRSLFRIVQTPQTFQVDKIKEAFQGEEKEIYTDDATVYEHVLGEQVTLVDGDYRNIKITTQEDLQVAALFLETKKPQANH